VSSQVYPGQVGNVTVYRRRFGMNNPGGERKGSSEGYKTDFEEFYQERHLNHKRDLARKLKK
jgi:hypothetical protein